MHHQLEQQLNTARREDGEIDLNMLLTMVQRLYEETDRERRRMSDTIASMSEQVGTIQGRLRDAFDVVPQGLALLDPEDRFVIWNRRYEELHPALSGRLTTGMTFEEALRICLEAGVYADAVGREEEWLYARLKRHALPQNIEEQRSTNGKWLRVEESRTADGGCISARIDITEFKEREESFRLLFESN